MERETATAKEVAAAGEERAEEVERAGMARGVSVAAEAWVAMAGG